uniref:Short-chain collagen C4-like n=1 Tax=Branchiostoma floridae TaxID=7739 RepID=C3Z6H8_BRAFL|eukprot:XP_002595810.1 hypothetical protein BRAFLDRAFT_96784 [Branchiostoma floridae]
MPERSARRDRAGGPPGALVGVLLGASAVFASAVVLAVIVQNIVHEMGELRARAERDREDIAKLLQETVFLRERIVVLETQSRDGSFLTSNVEQQTPDQTDPVPNPEGVIDAGVQSSNATPGGHLHRHRREAPNANWVRLPAGACVAGGTSYITSTDGGGTNYQCLPNNPQWGRYQDGVSGYSAYMYGAEYRVATNAPFGSTSLDAHDVPCTVCYVPTRGSKLMIPARNTCPTGWTEEYDGYLMAASYTHTATEYVCMDDNPETVQGGQGRQTSATRFYPVEARCGALQCPNYVEGRELTCVVCTK